MKEKKQFDVKLKIALFSHLKQQIIEYETGKYDSRGSGFIKYLEMSVTNFVL